MRRKIDVVFKSSDEIALVRQAAGIPDLAGLPGRSVSDWCRRILVREALREIREATNQNPRKTT